MADELRRIAVHQLGPAVGHGRQQPGIDGHRDARNAWLLPPALADRRTETAVTKHVIGVTIGVEIPFEHRNARVQRPKALGEVIRRPRGLTIDDTIDGPPERAVRRGKGVERLRSHCSWASFGAYGVTVAAVPCGIVSAGGAAITAVRRQW